MIEIIVQSEPDRIIVIKINLIFCLIQIRSTSMKYTQHIILNIINAFIITYTKNMITVT